MRTPMKRFAPLPIAMIAMILALTASIAAFRSPAAAQGDDEAAVRKALLQNAAGFERNDLAAVSQVWADDEGVTVLKAGRPTTVGPITAIIISGRRSKR